MKQAQRKQPVVSVDNAPGEVIILPPVQVRRTNRPSDWQAKFFEEDFSLTRIAEAAE